MKVLIVSSVYYPNIYGGTEKVAQGLAEALVARGHDVAVAALNWRKSYETAEVNGVRVHYLPLRNIYFPGRPQKRSAAMKLLWHAVDSYNPFMAASLGRVLDAEGPDVVNTHNIGGFSALAWKTVKSRRLALVNTTHGVNLLCPWYMTRNGTICHTRCLRCRLYARPRMLLSRKVDVLTGVSRFVVEKYCEQGGFANADKMVIYNACEIPSTAPVPICDGNRALRFGFLGRLDPDKGVELLVRSFLGLPAGQAELVIAGRGTPEYESELKMIANGRQGVRWLGFTRPDHLLGQTDVLVVPSLLNDTAPLAVLEGLGRGIPVIAARRGGIPELVGEGTGWVFDPDDPGALTRVMRSAIASREKFAAMSERACEWARRFSTDSMVNGYLQAYSRAIEKNYKSAEDRRAAAS